MGRGYRQGRLGEEIRKIISSMLLRDMKDPRLSTGMISISDVEVTADGSYATCYVTVLAFGSDADAKTKAEEDALEGLRSAKGMFKKEIGKQIKMRHIPELIFKLDTSMEYGRRIDEVIRNLDIKDEE
ncbi:MAG: 30S ribosome-binding factor RbfA [Firmicutes bacterium]|nr:30S ribosome-binding factor RbfA [Bacillota bacterium]